MIAILASIIAGLVAIVGGGVAAGVWQVRRGGALSDELVKAAQEISRLRRELDGAMRSVEDWRKIAADADKRAEGEAEARRRVEAEYDAQVQAAISSMDPSALSRSMRTELQRIAKPPSTPPPVSIPPRPRKG